MRVGLEHRRIRAASIYVYPVIAELLLSNGVANVRTFIDISIQRHEKMFYNISVLKVPYCGILFCVYLLFAYFYTLSHDPIEQKPLSVSPYILIKNAGLI